MRGTMRSLRDEMRDAMEAAIRRVAAGVAPTFGVEIDVRDPPRQAGDGEPRRRSATWPPWRPPGGRPAAAPRPAAGDDRRGFLLVPAAKSRRLRLDRQRPGRAGKGPAQPGYNYNDAILPAAASGYLAGVARRAPTGLTPHPRHPIVPISVIPSSLRHSRPPSVIPAKAGIHRHPHNRDRGADHRLRGHKNHKVTG